MKIAVNTWNGPSGRLLALGTLLLFPLAGCGGESGSDPLSPQDSIPSPVPCTLPDTRCMERVSLGGGLFLQVFRTHPLLSPDTTVVRAVIVVHGADRNAHTYFGTMLEATTSANRMEGTLVVSPRFQTADDGPAGDEARWTSSGWKKGHLSVAFSSSQTRVSSYEAADHLLRLLGDSLRFPKLETVVVTGHSAGGQYTHRFAATSPSEGDLRHLRFRYVVANPSTYLYLGPERARPEGGFVLPDRIACPDYNLWHYGLEERNTYALRLTESEIRARLLERDVVYLVGREDVGTSALDMSCGAMLQGERRYPRGLTLFAYLEAFFPGHRHQLFEISGVAHSSRGIYTSEIGRSTLFQW